MLKKEFSECIHQFENNIAYGIPMEYLKSGKQVFITKSENHVLRLLTILQWLFTTTLFGC